MSAAARPSSPIDAVNGAAMRDPGAVAAYAGSRGLTPPEAAILDALAPELAGRPILDLGVGGGRTIPALVALSDDYLGIDCEPRMVAACRAAYPTRDVQVGDARNLSALPAGHFGLVLFSCNGLCMVGHDDRRTILREVRRVLAADGVFVFSSYNRDSDAYRDRSLRLPDFRPSLNPLRAAVRAGRFVHASVRSVRNRRALRLLEEHTGEYAIINDRCHDYGTLLYYITPAGQRRQLADAGFGGPVTAFGHDGRPAADDARDDSLYYVVRP